MKGPENWRPCPGFPLYVVSDQGNVRHRDRYTNKKVVLNEEGYPTVDLAKKKIGGTRYRVRVDELVAGAFLHVPKEAREGKDPLVINHLDGDLTNCRLNNIEYDISFLDGLGTLYPAEVEGSFPGEIWRFIPDIPDYLVSNYGRVKPVAKSKMVSVRYPPSGQPCVSLYPKGGTATVRQINKLVARAFLGPPTVNRVGENEDHVWHLDGNLLNCASSNLRWETKWRVLEWNNLHRPPPNPIAARNPDRNIPVVDRLTNIHYPSLHDCAKALGVTPRDISRDRLLYIQEGEAPMAHNVRFMLVSQLDEPGLADYEPR